MTELLDLVPWVLFFGIVLIGLSRWGRFDEDQRRKMWTVGIIAIAASVLGLLYIYQAPPGREITIEEDRDNRPTPKPNQTTLLKDQLDAPWTTESQSDWAVSKLMVNLCQIGYQDPIDARDEFKRLGLSIRQPFVEAIMRGIKTTEYRSSATKIRGRILINASQTRYKEDEEADMLEEFGITDATADDLPRGVIIGSVELHDSDEGEWYLRNPQRAIKCVTPVNHPNPVWFYQFSNVHE
jgi:hypothetical protein